VVFEPVLGTVNEFIDYALIIAGIMIIYYIVRFFTVGGPSKETKQEEERQRVEQFKGWVGKKTEEHKNKKAAAGRTALLKPASGFIIRVHDNADKATDALDDNSVAGASRAVGRIKDDLKSARRLLRVVRGKVKADKKVHVKELIALVEKMEKDVHDKITLPTDFKAPNWKNLVVEPKENLEALKTSCGTVLKMIDEFVETEKVTP